MSKILVGSNFTGFKNRIINGDFKVWQRGASASFVATGTASAFGYIADRFYHSAYSDTAGGFIVEPSNIEGSSSIKITVDTAFTNASTASYWRPLKYTFEGQHLYDIAAKSGYVTISFLFRSNVAGKYSVSMRNMTDTTVQFQSFVTTFDYTASGVPQRIEIVVPLNHVWNPLLRDDENRGFDMDIAFLNYGNYATATLNQWQDLNVLTVSDAVNWGAAVGNYIEIAELQLEEGKYVTSFEKVPYDIQLLRCQRYYCDLQSVYLLRYADVSTAFAQVSLPVQMRVNPTVERYAETLIDMSFFASYTDKNLLTEYYTIDAAGGYGSIYVRLYAEL